MAAPRRTKFVPVNLTLPARHALQQAALALSAAAGRRLSMSAVLLAMASVAQNYPDEVLAALPATPDVVEEI